MWTHRLWKCRMKSWERDGKGRRHLDYECWIWHMGQQKSSVRFLQGYCVMLLWTWHLTRMTRDRYTDQTSRELETQWTHSQEHLTFSTGQKSCEPNWIVYNFSEHLQFCTESSQWLNTLGSGADPFSTPHDKFRSWSGRNNWWSQQWVRLTGDSMWAPTGMRLWRLGRGTTFWCSAKRLSCINSHLKFISACYHS